ncbi:hypothetical protein M3Y97_00457300 [Aphelenchoides bicaudatus]|nr:hypothetical protein M3Y97_00457300 [Aphelenchoides bicaudatus]
MARTITNHGINFELALSSIQEQPNNDVAFESEFILNGVCIRLKGRQAQIEFNAERAEIERQQAMNAAQYSQRLADIRRMIQ